MGSDLLKNKRTRLSWDELRKADDDDLIRQLAAGYHDALAVIVDRYQRLVLSVALRIVKDECEAEDVVQIVFTDIFKDVARFDATRGTLKVWLLQYAYGRSINRRRYLERRQFYLQARVEEIDNLNLPANSGIEGLSTGETVRLVRQGLGALNTKQRRAIELVYFEGLTLDEAAQRTGDTVPAVRHHYYRGLMKLREVINASQMPEKEEPLRARGIRLGVRNVRPRPI